MAADTRAGKAREKARQEKNHYKRRALAAEAVLAAIRDYEPGEIVKDGFAYDRMVENYRSAARALLKDN